MIRTSLKSINVILVLLIFIGCSSDKKTWKIAQENDDFVSYKFYIEKQKYGKYVDDAKFKIEEIGSPQHYKPPQLPETIIPTISQWNNKTVNELTLNVNITSPQSSEYQSTYNLKYYEIIKEKLENIGVQVVHKSHEGNTAMNVDLNVKALAGNYFNVGFLYTGYKIDGSITLTSKGESPITLFIKENNPVDAVASANDGYSFKEKSEPIYGLKQANSNKYFWEFFKKVWGPSPLVWISKSGGTMPIELQSDYDGEISVELKNNIIRACYSHTSNVQENAIRLLIKHNLHKDKSIAMPIIRDHINRYNIIMASVLKGIKLNFDLLTIINYQGQDAIEATPTLISYADEKRKAGWDHENEPKIIYGMLEEITGQEFDGDINSWKEWWFYNKSSIID